MREKVKIEAIEGGKFVVRYKEEAYVEDTEKKAKKRKHELEQVALNEQINLTNISGKKEVKKYGGKEALVKGDVEIIVKDCVDLILKGYDYSEIVSQLSYQHQLNYNSAYNYIKKAQDEIKSHTAVDIEETIRIHTNKWEKLYKKFLDIGQHKLSIKCLQFKEKINGIHQQQTSLILNQFEEEIEERSVYDLNKLSKEESERLRFLLNKINVT
jgi:hypothetical protein